jgi:hypothetical protein
MANYNSPKSVCAHATTNFIDVLTCPTNSYLSAHGVLISNTYSSEVKVSLRVFKSSVNDNFVILNEIEIPVNTTYYIDRTINLEQSDKLQFKANIALSSDIVVSYVLNTESS